MARPKPPKSLKCWALWIDYKSDPKYPQHPGHFFPYSGKVPELFPTLSEARSRQMSSTHSRVVRMEIKVR